MLFSAPKNSLSCTVSILCLLCLAGPVHAQPHPIHTSGRISSIYNEFDSSVSGENSSYWLNIATINASSYIWQPWFALINGSLSLTLLEEDSSASGEIENETVDGSFRFNLFPTSRFPFVLYGSQSRFEQDSLVNDRFYSLTTLGMQQSYASLDGNQSYYASYRTQDRDDQSGNDSSIEIFSFGANVRFEEHNISSSLNHSSNTETRVRDQSNTAFLMRHSYTGRSDLSLENQLSASQDDDEFGQITNDQDTRQFTSFASWAPNNRKDLNITGSVRASDRKDTFINRISATTASQPIERVNLNLNQGLNYRLSDNLAFRESVNISSNKQQNNETVIYSESVGVSYTASLISLKGGEYNWFAGTNLNQLHGDSIESNVSLDSQLGHNYRRKLFINPEISINASFGQSLSIINATKGEDSDRIGNSASLSWSDSGVSTKTFIRLSATDSRSLEDDSNRQLYNLQANQYYKLDRSTTFSTELTLQRSRDSGPDGKSGVRLIAGQVNYTDLRFLNLNGLTYRSLIKISDQRPDIGTLNPNTKSANSLSWENDWVYRIGLFESRLSFDYIKSDNDYNTVIRIELTRFFGDL